MNDSILEYLTRKISATEFLKCVMEDDALYARIQNKVPQSSFAHDSVWKCSPICAEAFQYDDFDLRKTLSRGYYALTRVQRCGAAYRLIFDLFHDEYPGLAYDPYYDEISRIAIDEVPIYADSMEAGEVLFHIVESTNGMEPQARKKAIREQIKDRFHLEKTAKQPRWVQESEWPVEDGEPLAFLAQKKMGEKVEYRFENPKTHRQQVITQFY